LGYERAIHEHRMNSWMVKFDYLTAKTTDITDDIEQFMQQNRQMDALFFATNYLAISGIEVLGRLKIKIGEEMGIVVFDDNDLFRIHQPTISAIAQPVHEMSKQLILTLLEHMNGNGLKQIYNPQKHILPATLIKRASSQKQILQH
jgi:LacI family transcriptional regulator